MKQKLEQVERPEQPEAIGMENLPQLDVDAKELEAILTKIGAKIDHPVRLDPVARIDGRVVGFWVE